MTVAAQLRRASDLVLRKMSFSARAPVSAAFARRTAANEGRAGSDVRGRAGSWLASESHECRQLSGSAN